MSAPAAQSARPGLTPPPSGPSAGAPRDVEAHLVATLERLAPRGDATAEAPTPCVEARPRRDAAPKREGKVDRHG